MGEKFMRMPVILALLGAPTAAFAQDTAKEAPIVATPATAPTVLTARQSDVSNMLPANTKVFMTMDEEVSSKRFKKGETFRLTVSNDVMYAQYVVIPRGTAAVGEVTWKTGRAVFGKSGKMTVEIRYLDLEGRRIPLTGEYRQEGDGNTIAAVGAVVLAAPLLFVTGKSARIPKGRELTAYTRDPLPVSVPTN